MIRNVQPKFKWQDNFEEIYEEAYRSGKRMSLGEYPGLRVIPEKNIKMPPKKRGRQMTRSTSRGRSLTPMSLSRSKSRAQSAPAVAGAYRKRVSYVDMPGVAGGKLRRLRKRKVYKNKKAYRQYNGVVLTKESGLNVQNRYSVIVGHSTCPAYTTRLMMWRAAAKSLFSRGGINVTTVDETLPFVAVGDQIFVNYRQAPVAVNNFQFFTFAASPNLEQFAVWAADVARPWNTASLIPNEFHFLRLTYSPTVSTVVGVINMQLDQTVLELYCKSSLKMQNQTRIVGTDTTESVNNVPLYGKGYGGSGSGSVYRSYTTNATPVNSDNTFGIIGSIPSGPTDPIAEPPEGVEFARIKSQGKIRLDPGQIKTSIAVYKRNFSFNSLHQKLNYVGAPAATVAARDSQRYHTIGQFKIYVLEKLMDSGSDANIRVDIEHNLRMSMVAKCKLKTLTIQKVEITY